MPVSLEDAVRNMALIDAILPLVERPLPSGLDYADAYLEIARRLSGWGRQTRPPLWGDRLARWAEETAKIMETWVAACRYLAPKDQA